MERPLIAIVNSYNELHPGHCHLRGIAEAVKVGVEEAGGTPMEFNTIALCDAISTRGTGGSYKYILPSRDLIADSIETVVECGRYDGMVLICTCDKIVPGHLMGAARVDIPATFVTGGPMMPGRAKGKEIEGGTVKALEEVERARIAFEKGQITEENYKKVRKIYEDCLFPGPGGCYGMGTANTMMCLTEALGMSIPGMALAHAVDAEKKRMAKKSGAKVMELLEEEIKPSDIMNIEAFENAIAVNNAIGGSSNAAIHLPAIAYQLGIELPAELWNEISEKTPYLCHMQSVGPYTMRDLQDAGGIPAVMNEIRGMLHLDALTVTGKTLGENIKDAKVYRRDVIRPVADPVRKEGAIIWLSGSLAPEGAVAKKSGWRKDMLTHWKDGGFAKVFNEEEDAIEAIRKGEVGEEDVLVVRYLGPKGYPGSKESSVLPILSAHGLGQKCVLVTDGRLSGYGHNLFVCHVSPEAQAGGPIAVVKNGDKICINLKRKRIDLKVSDREIKRRLAEWKPKKIVEKGYLKRYIELVSPLTKGAVL